MLRGASSSERWTRLSFAVAFAWGLGSHAIWPAAVSAEATVAVTLKAADGQVVEGKVVLTGADGKVIGTCKTQAGRCEIGSVPGGMHTVTVEPAKGAAPKPRKVMIPPTGKVSLVVTSS